MSKIRIIKDIQNVRNLTDNETEIKNKSTEEDLQKEYKRNNSIILKIPKLNLHNASFNTKKEFIKEIIVPSRNKSSNKIALLNVSKNKNQVKNKIPNNKKPNKVLIPKDELIAQIRVLWKKLGVTSKFQEIFKNHYIKVPILYRDDYLKYEIDRLKNFDVFIKKIKKDISSREKMIEFLKKCENPNVFKKRNEEQLIENLAKILNELKQISFTIINNYINIRKQFGFEAFIVKYDVDRIQEFKKDYLLKIKFDTEFIYKSPLNKYFNFEMDNFPFVTFNLNEKYVDKITILKDNDNESIRKYQFILITESIYAELYKFNHHDYTLSSSNSVVSMASSKRKKQDLSSLIHNQMINKNNKSNKNKIYYVKPIKLNIKDINKNGFKKKPNPISLITSHRSYYDGNKKNRSPLIKTKINNKKSKNKILKCKSEVYIKTDPNNKIVFGMQKNDLDIIDAIINRSIMLNKKNINNNINLTNNSSGTIIEKEKDKETEKIKEKIKIKTKDKKKCIKEEQLNDNEKKKELKSEEKKENKLKEKDNFEVNKTEKIEYKLKIINSNIEDDYRLSNKEEEKSCSSNTDKISEPLLKREKENEEKLTEEDIQENIIEDTINEDIQIQNGYKYYIQVFNGNIYLFNEIFSDFIVKIPEEQKISFNIEDNLSKYICGIYPRILMLKNNKGKIQGLTIISFDPFSIENKSINLLLICSLTNEILSDILIDVKKYISENLDYDEIRIEFFYGNKDGQFYLFKEIEKSIKDEGKFKWVNMENDGINRKIKYKYQNPNKNNILFSSGKYILELKTASIVSFSSNDDKKEISYINSNNLNDFGIISIFSEMILHKNYKLSFCHENTSSFNEFLKTLKFNKFKKITSDFIQNQLGTFDEMKDFIKENLDSLTYMINDSLLKTSLIGTSLMKIEVAFETVIKTSINGYLYNIIVNNDIEVFSYKDEEDNNNEIQLFYFVHSINENISFIIHEFKNNSTFEYFVDNNSDDNKNICDIFQIIYSKLKEQPEKLMRKIYLPSFKISNSTIVNKPSFLKGTKLINENGKFQVESFNQIENFSLGIEINKNNLTNSQIELENIDENKDIVIKNDFLIALINPDLLSDLQLPTLSAFIIKKDSWEKSEDESDSYE